MQQQTGPSEELLREIEENPQGGASDKLDHLRTICARARDVDLAITDLEARLEFEKQKKYVLLRETIPDAMEQCGVPAITIEADGNKPRVEVSVRPHYSASIAAPQSAKNKNGWPEPRRQAAFAALAELDAGDLVKVTITVRFARDRAALARELYAQLVAAGNDAEMTEAVASQTLTKWLKERHKAGLPLPPLDAIGGFVGRIAVVEVVEP